MDQPSQPPPAKKWTGWAVTLFTIGLLILVPSGICTSIFGVGALVDGGSGSEDWGFLLMALLYGGPFIAIGGGLVLAGLSIRKRG
ncbi:MAG TPA: hypothetical protein VMH86_10365 [Rhizomicrobium sp.]|nr:hypothetical protein [Rhizomicrobium sp.]